MQGTFHKLPNRGWADYNLPTINQADWTIFNNFLILPAVYIPPKADCKRRNFPNRLRHTYDESKTWKNVDF